jgi:hypothetical protein
MITTTLFSASYSCKQNVLSVRSRAAHRLRTPKMWKRGCDVRAVPVARHFTSPVGGCTHHFTGTPHILPALLGTTMRGSIMTRYRCSLAIIYPSRCMLGLAFALMIDPTSWTWIRRSHHRTLRRWTCRPDLMCLLPQVVCNPGGEVTCYRYKGSEFQKELEGARISFGPMTKTSQAKSC